MSSILETVPTYEFKCPKGHDFERFYKTISGAPSEVECPECGAMASRQLSGGAGLLFKGSGFYLTDYGKNAHRGDAKKTDAKADGKADVKADAKADVKADAKADVKAKSEPAAKPANKPKPKSE